MSTKIKKILPKGSKGHGKSTTMEPSLLAQTAKRIRDEAGYTLDQVVANSGGEISGGYISKIENGEDLNISLDKLFALAKGLKVSAQLLFDVAQGEPPKDGINIDRVVTIMRGLNESDQRLAARLVEVLSVAKENGENDLGGMTGDNEPPHPPIDTLTSKNLGRRKPDKKREIS